MDRSEYYQYYQANLDLLSLEIEHVKKETQHMIGKKAWQVEAQLDANQIAKTEKEIKACTRLFSFLVCSWFEARLMKILCENSSAAFTDGEINSIKRKSTMELKWQSCFNMAVCKAYGFTYMDNHNYCANFAPNSVELSNYSDICVFFNDIRDAITIRNRLAHGQWDFQFNSEGTNLVQYSFLDIYDNVQKLDILKQCYSEIAEIINSYVVYKDKRNPNFNKQIRDRICSVKNKQTRIQRVDYQKYALGLGKKYKKRQEFYKSMKSKEDGN